MSEAQMRKKSRRNRKVRLEKGRHVLSVPVLWRWVFACVRLESGQ